MLGEVGDERVDLGEGATDGEVGAAAFKRGNKLQILLFRQKMKDLGLPPEPVTIKAEMADAPGNVSLRRIDETHCNPYRVWREGGSREGLTPAQAEEIRQKSLMTTEELPYRYENGLLIVEAQLSVNDVWLVEIGS